MRSVEEIKAELLEQNNGAKTLYQPLEHAEFSEWTHAQPCKERWLMITEHLDTSKQGTCLDLGCHTGWFCREFANLKWKVTGIDKNPLAIEIARDHMASHGSTDSPSYRTGDFREMKLPRVDVILCLSLVMYLFDEGKKDGWRTLHKLSGLSPIMFVDFGGMYSGKLPFTQENASIEFVHNTDYASCELIGTTHMEERPFYLLRR